MSWQPNTGQRPDCTTIDVRLDRRDVETGTWIDIGERYGWKSATTFWGDTRPIRVREWREAQ